MVEFKSARNREVGGSVHECRGAPTARRQSVAGWVGVCLVLAGGFNLSEIARQTNVAAVQSAATFLFYIALIFGRHWRNLPRLDRWTRQRALLARFPAPSDATLSAHQQTNHSGFCFLSVTDISYRRIILGWGKPKLCPEQERKGGSRESSHSLCLSPQRCCKKRSVARHMVLFVRKAL